jgi:hypothetical protein
VWFKVDDSFWSHPKVIAAGNAAIGLWVRCGSWCAEHKTDGRIPEAFAKQVGSPSQIGKLLTAGLWTAVDNPCGYLMHDWPDYQPTKQTLREMSEKNVERQRRFRTNHAADDADSHGEPQARATSNGVSNASPSRTTRVDPTHPNPIDGVAVVGPATGSARPRDDGKADLASKQAEQSRRKRKAKDST